jgi:hypothetical protein
VTDPSTMSPEELDRRFAHGSAVRDADDEPIMDTIRKNYEQGQRELGWWGRFLMRHHFSSIVKPPLLPWMPEGVYEVLSIILLAVVLTGVTIYTVEQVLIACSK